MVNKISDIKHDILHHPFQRRERYEIHKIDAVFTGFGDDTLDTVIKSACGDFKIGIAVDASIKTDRVLKKLVGKSDESDEVILIKRTKEGYIKPIMANIDNGKGKKKRGARIEKRIEEIAKQYSEAADDKLVSIRKENHGIN